MQCELLFTNEDESFIQWMENLENHCYQQLYNRRKDWFTSDMEMNDIENYFVSPLKIYKSGKFYILKVNVTPTLGKTNLKIYDENETPLEMDSIQENTKVITILEVQSVKCSARSFQIEVELKQMMVLNPTDIFEKCIIKSNSIPSIEPIKENSPDPKETIPESQPDIESPSQSDNEDVPSSNPVDIETESVVAATDVETPSTEIMEVELDLEKIPETDSFQIKKRNDIYYKIYLEAKQKAKLAKDLALSAYLEAKRIKNTYLLEDSEEEEEMDESYLANV